MNIRCLGIQSNQVRRSWPWRMSLWNKMPSQLLRLHLHMVKMLEYGNRLIVAKDGHIVQDSSTKKKKPKNDLIWLNINCLRKNMIKARKNMKIGNCERSQVHLSFPTAWACSLLRYKGRSGCWVKIGSRQKSVIRIRFPVVPLSAQLSSCKKDAKSA